MDELNGDRVDVEGEVKSVEYNRYGFVGGKRLTDTSDESRLSTKVIISREKKWRQMCNNWEYWTKSKIKLRDRCRKGIPDSMRCEAWQRLCSSPMVLVPRTKVIVHDSLTDLKDTPSNTNSLKVSLLKPFLSVANEPKSTPSVITTSPSFRIKRSNAEARRKMILRKLYGDNGPPPREDVKVGRSSDSNSLIVSSKWLDSASTSGRTDPGNSALGHGAYPSCESFSFPADPTWSASNSFVNVSVEPSPDAGAEQQRSAQAKPGPNGDLGFLPTSIARDLVPNPSTISLHNFTTTSNPFAGSDSPQPDAVHHNCLMTSSEPCKQSGDILLPPLAVPTIARPKATFRSYHTFTVDRQVTSKRVMTTCAVSIGANETAMPVPPIITSTLAAAGASSSSGGYASLSTDSSALAGHFPPVCDSPNRLGMQDRDSLISYRSSLSSTSSAIFPPPEEGALTRPVPLRGRAKTSSRSSCQSIILMGDDARATLVPPGDPDPVELYYSYCRAEGQPSVCDQIRKDIDRQFPNHELFCQKDGHGQQTLYTMLKAYTVRHPEKGYCQGQAPLAAVLIMFMPEVDAFWTFNEVCERYLDAYYDDGLDRVQIDAQILYTLLKGSYFEVYKFLRKNSVDPILIVLEWFLCVFTRTLPWSAVLRVLDMFFCEGKVVLFRVAIVLLRRMFGTMAQRRECSGMDEILLRLRDVHSVVKDTDKFVEETVRIGLAPRDLAQEAVRHSRKWDQNKGCRDSVGRSTTQLQ